MLPVWTANVGLTIHKINTHIENNGYIDDVKIIMKPPFDKPFSFIKMFDTTKRELIIGIIENIKSNAEMISA